MKRKIITTLLTASLLLTMPGTTSVLADTHDAKTELLQEDIADVHFDAKEEDSEGSLSFIEEKGYAEGAYVTFNGASTDKYHAFVSTSPDGDWTPLDDELIRYYVNGTWRVDALGLTSRTWYIKVQKDGGESLVSAPLYVYAHDRSGFAWAGGGTASGAYNEDGSLKENAKVIYVTDENKDDLYASITLKGNVKNCYSLVEVLNAIKNSKSGEGETDPICIRFIGNVHDPEGFSDTGTYNGDMLILNNNDTTGITIEGVGDDATANGWGIRLKNSSNVEVRNLGFMNCDSKEGDDVGLQQDNDHIWIHNCDLFYGEAGTDEDQVKGDGAMDCKRSTYSVFSYNHFWDNGKCNLLGLNEDTTEGLYVTYHHNWYDHSDSRHPRTRYYSAHVYNNYYDGNAKYGSGATLGASVFMDSNYFRNCHYPMMISLQGTDSIYAGGTFSGEDGGMIKAYGNRFAGKYTFVPYARAYMVRDGNIIDPNIEGIDSGEDFDAYPVKERTDTVPGTVESKEGGNHYNNFDTDENVDLGVDPENIDKADYVPETVMTRAGRAGGGDFWFNFTDGSDDTAYEVNDALKAAIKTYKSNLVQVGSQDAVAISDHNETSISYTRIERSAVSNTNGIVYNEFSNKNPDEMIEIIPYVTETFDASEFVRNELKIYSNPDGTDIASPTKYGIFTLSSCRVPSKKVDVIALDNTEGKDAAFVIDAPKKGILTFSVMAAKDGAKVYVQLLYRGQPVKDKLGRETVTLTSRNAYALSYEIPYTGTYTFCYKTDKQSDQVRIASCKLRMKESDEPNPQPEPEPEPDPEPEPEPTPDPSVVSGNTVILIAKDKTFNVGEKLMLLSENAAVIAAAKAADPKVKFKFEVADKASKKVLSVNSKGIVKAKKAGSAVICVKYKAKVDGKKQWVYLPGKYTVIVQAPAFSVKKITMTLSGSDASPAAVDLNGLLNAGSTTLPMTDFASSKPAVAAVSDKGVVTALAKGSAKITFKIGNVGFKLSVKVSDK